MVMIRWLLRAVCLILALACLCGSVLVGSQGWKQMRANQALRATSLKGTLLEIVAKFPKDCLVEANDSRVDLARASYGPDFGVAGAVLAVPVWPSSVKASKGTKAPPVVALSQRNDWMVTYQAWRKARDNRKELRDFLRGHKSEMTPSLQLNGLVSSREELSAPEQALVDHSLGSSSLVLREGFVPDLQRPYADAGKTLGLLVLTALFGAGALWKVKPPPKLPGLDEVSLEPLSVTEADAIKLVWGPWQGSRFVVGGGSSDLVSLDSEGRLVFRNLTALDVLMGTPAVMFRKARTTLNELLVTEELKALPADHRSLALSALVQAGLGDAAIELMAQTGNEALVSRCAALWNDCISAQHGSTKPSLLTAGLEMDGHTRSRWTCAILTARLGLSPEQTGRLKSFLDRALEGFRGNLESRYSELGTPQDIDA